MEFLSFKEQNNVATKIYEKSSLDVFMSNKNKLLLTKEIYLLHKGNNGILDYLYFKNVVESAMIEWISNMLAMNDCDTRSMDILVFLNKTFIKTHGYLYEYKSRDKIEVLVDTNVYRSEASIGYCDDDDNIQIQQKKYKDLLASEYGSIDVWKEQSVEMTPDSRARYGIKVPFYQRTMQIRHYDRSNEGYSTTADRASLNNFVSGYGSALTAIQNKKDELYKKYNST